MLTVSLAFLFLGNTAGPTIHATNLRTEYRTEPRGIGTARPRFSWELLANRAETRGLSQSKFHILVASSPEILSSDRGDLFDSGEMVGPSSNQIEYAGKELDSRSRGFWKVGIWDQAGTFCGWTRPATFSLGLLHQSDWKADWIGFDSAAPEPLTGQVRDHFKALPWIKRRNAPQRQPQQAWFRKAFTLEQGKPIRAAWVALTADEFAEVHFNGVIVANVARWNMLNAIDLRHRLAAGENVFALHITQQDGLEPAATGEVHIDFEDGTTQLVPLDKTWKVTNKSEPGWDLLGHDDSGWSSIAVGNPAWGGNRNTEHFFDAPPLMRTEFAVRKAVRSATLYATALGLYECSLNGRRVGSDLFTPGWTDYRKRVLHQTYDVTKMIRAGENAIGVTLGDGWYAGLMGYTGQRRYYGGEPRFRGQLEIEYTDGTQESVLSDGSWKASSGPIRYSDLYMGTLIDARINPGNWATAGYNGTDWKPVVTGFKPLVLGADVTTKAVAATKNGVLDLAVDPIVLGDPAYGHEKRLIIDYTVNGAPKRRTFSESQVAHLPAKGESGSVMVLKAMFTPVDAIAAESFAIEPAPTEPVRKQEELPAKAVSSPGPDHYIYDIGQNMVGYIRLRVRGAAGTTLTLRHAEMLNPDGTMYTSNLRGATAVDYFTLSGGVDTFEPKFTFHGFRYVEISGLDHALALGDVTGIVTHTELKRTGSFASSSAPLNQLYHNIIWGQKGNYLEVPTDCPQRDERLGWTGDAQFFIGAASYNFDVASFFTKWVTTLAEDGQLPDGSFGHVAPLIGTGGGSTAWGDAAIVCTYNVWRTYNDTRIVREHWDAFTRYMAWLDSKTKDGIATVGGFGDWVNLGDPTDARLIDTAYRSELTRMMSEMAMAIGHSDDVAKYQHQNHDSVNAFHRDFVADDGSLRKSGQTGYALAFTMNLIPSNKVKAASDHFVETLRVRDWHLSTGFIGTPRLLPALHLAGRDDIAYKLMLQDTYPSWLYQVKLGATTMWERWNGFLPEQGFADVGMNSFNHYAFGSVGQYLYQDVAGITGTAPGYETVAIQPRIEAGLTHGAASYDSIRGKISSSWRRVDAGLELTIVVPVNVVATIDLPGSGVTESGSPLSSNRDITVLGGNRVRVGSGTYRFAMSEPVRAR